MRQRFVRKIVVSPEKNKTTAIRCSECAWLYTIHHLSEIVDEIEEHQATRLYTTIPARTSRRDELIETASLIAL